MQWDKLTKIEGFSHLKTDNRVSNNGREKDRENIYRDIRKGLESYTTDKFIKICLENHLAIAPVNNIKEVANMDLIDELMVKTKLPNGKNVKMFPAPMNTDFLNKNNNTLPCAPKLGEQNESVFIEAGLTNEDISALKKNKII